MRTRFGLSCIAVLISATFAEDVSAQEKPLAEAYNASAQILFKQFTAEPGNIVFSPYSIGTAMAMALSGARTSTETEMLSVLKHKMSRLEIDAANGKLMAILNGYDRSALPPNCPAGMKLDGQRCLSQPVKDVCPYGARKDEFKNCVATPTPQLWAKVLTANALMMPRATDEISFSYVDQLRDSFGAEVFRGAGLDQINGWVKQKTDGKIDKILDRLDPSSPAVLLNAIYFKAAWASPFLKQATKEANFNLSRGQQVRVPTMYKTGHYAVVNRTGYRAIRLPYVIRSIGMVVVLPNDLEGIADATRRLDARELSDLLVAVRTAPTKYVELALPRFKITFRADLKQAFQQIGLSSPFSRDQADFSGMTGRPVSQARLMIGQIRHAAVIDVQEAGTEAAAATAIEMVPTSVPPRPEAFLVDRPFLFYIVDDMTGAILFVGRVRDPR